jgi:site-specific recombinase XerD
MVDKYWELTKQLPNKENQEVLKEFLLSLKIANLSERTIINYRRFLERFFSDMETSILSLSSNMILEWFQKYKGNINESTYQNRLYILSSFYNFCIQEGHMEHSPIKRRWFPRVPKPVPKYLEKGDIAKTRKQSERTSLRNQVIFEFMLTSGCRVGEVHRLNLEDVNLETRTARVMGKGKKIRPVHFTETCSLLLERYIETRKEKSDPALFISSTTGKRLSIRGIQKIIKEIGKKAEPSVNLHPHRLRHTFATELLAKGAELSFIGEELGHANLGTTQIYARLPKQEIISQYRKFMG